MGQSYQKKGSLAFRPRKRADSQMPRIKAWPSSAEKKLLGFAGYKAGMTHIIMVDDSLSPNKGNEVVKAATIVEVPPMVVFGIRGSKRGQVVADKLTSDEKILKELGMKSKKKNELDASKLDDIYVLAYARPKACGFGKKHPEKMEIAVGGKDIAERLEYANSLLGKEVKVSDVFKPGEYFDAVSITTGKGWQGTVKRFGTSTQRRKATGKKRHIGTLGAWHPAYVQYTVPMAGQMGYHKRTEINKRIIKISTPQEMNVPGGYPHYGVLKNDTIVVVGSLGGPIKRLIRMRKAIRKTDAKTPDVRYVSTESK